MTGSRWTDTAEDAALDAKRKQEREEKKRLKAEKARRLEEERLAKEAAKREQAVRDDGRPAKRRKLTPARDGGASAASNGASQRNLLRFQSAPLGPCRNVEVFEKLNDIEEGTYGYVSRAKETATGKIVALKRLKIEPGEQNGFPVTALREIKVLRNCDHRNIVRLQEIVIGEDINKTANVYLVLEFVEHDLRTILETQTDPFLPSETKQLALQLAQGVSYLHSNYILHRDLKTSNLLLSNRGTLKIADFGMARYVGDPPPKLTSLVVTLWYRPPELLLGAKTYDAAVDMWSVGCIFGELIERNAMFRGKNEVEQISKIFADLGIPTDESWPEFRRLPNAKALKLPRKSGSMEDMIRPRFPDLTKAGCALLRDLLSLNPQKRPTAKEMLQHPYFEEKPKPKPESLFPTFPSKANQERRPRREPNAPVRGTVAELGEVDCTHLFGGRENEAKGAGFRLRMG